MNSGKEICEELKSLRRYIAKQFGLDYKPTECHHKGNCQGTCPRCDEELRDLQRQLDEKFVCHIDINHLMDIEYQTFNQKRLAEQAAQLDKLCNDRLSQVTGFVADPNIYQLNGRIVGYVQDLPDLKLKLGQDWKSLDEDSIKKEFEQLAEVFLYNVIIEKGERQYYRITDIEFYLYTPSHRDIITYPRNCKAGQWFFHSSGVDISFESKVGAARKEKTNRIMAHLTEDSVFGGILIRGIKQVSQDGRTIADFAGPQIACYELFDKFDAFGDVSNFPKLSIFQIKKTGEIKEPIARHNLLSKDKTAKMKVKSILANNYCGSEVAEKDLVESFNEYLDAKYRFHI